MQAEGSGFSALDLRLRDTGRELGFFGVYGLERSLSLGLDINDTTGGAAHAQAFARLPLRQRDHGWQLAAELALGANRQSEIWRPMGKVTLSAGRGFAWRARSGWVSADLARSLRDGGKSRAWKLDATLGLNPRRHVAPMLQMEYFHPDQGDPSLALLPSLRLERPDRRVWLAGLEWRRSLGASPDPRLSLRLGLWQPF